MVGGKWKEEETFVPHENDMKFKCQCLQTKTHGHTATPIHSPAVCGGCHTLQAALCSCVTDPVAGKTGNSGYLAIYRKGMLAPGLEPAYLPVSSGQGAEISNGALCPTP